MKKITIFFLFLFFSLCLHATSIVSSNDPGDQIMIPLGDGSSIISLNDYLTLSPKEYRMITGQKMTLKKK